MLHDQVTELPDGLLQCGRRIRINDDVADVMCCEHLRDVRCRIITAKLLAEMRLHAGTKHSRPFQPRRVGVLKKATLPFSRGSRLIRSTIRRCAAHARMNSSRSSALNAAAMRKSWTWGAEAASIGRPASTPRTATAFAVSARRRETGKGCNCGSHRHGHHENDGVEITQIRGAREENQRKAHQTCHDNALAPPTGQGNGVITNGRISSGTNPSAPGDDSRYPRCGTWRGKGLAGQHSRPHSKVGNESK